MSMYDTLNQEQKKGVFTTEGPVLILAGAGSGKTRVLTHRIAYLIEEKGVSPYQIMAITFTNKAAGEMRERVNKMLECDAQSVWVSTFHSTCVRILRRYIDRLGYETGFTIYDTEDQKTVMKEICKRLQIDTKIHKERAFLNAISSAKDELIDPIEFSNRAAGDYNKRLQAQVYVEYQKVLKQNNALDFDDLIFKTVELFRLDKEVLEAYQERFRYIMVDEYQDTNTAQFQLIYLLASKYKNLCVVGDDDQSIYKFRGANIYNILNFEQHFPDATVIKLEQNYRSTQNILDAANGVIANNIGRKEKALWTENSKGEKVGFKQLENDYEEANFVVREIASKVRKGEYTYKDFAILYRTNAQSRLFEERFVNANIPYKIVGGVNFYSRKEIKDLLAYLKLIDNGQDDLAVKRIINVPKRGIGAATINKVTDYAMEQEISFFTALQRAETIPTLGKAAQKIRPFVLFIESMRTRLKHGTSLLGLMEEIIETTGYVKELEEDGSDEAKGRIENIEELINKIADYEETAEEPNLSDFLEEVALVADIDSLDEDCDYVVLMTLHSAKGLEFPNVYLSGMEDGLFPSYMSITSSDAANEIEEERRLAYVGITRAKEKLTITAAKSRRVHGMMQFNRVSRFVKEIPEFLLSTAIYEPKATEIPIMDTAYQKAKKAFRTTLTSYSSYDTAENKIGFGIPTPKEPIYTPVSNQRAFSSANTQKTALSYDIGDRVRHIKYGDGKVIAIIEGGKDYEITVDFDKYGTKKMFASFAKLKKI